MLRFWRRSWWSLDRVVDITFAVALAVLTVVNIVFPEPSMAYDYPPPNPLQLTLAVIASLVFALRRVAPATTYFVMLVITGGITAAGWSAGMLPYGLFFAIYSLAAYAPVRLAIAGLVANYMHDVLLFALGVPYFEDAYVLLKVAWFTGGFSAGLLTREVRRARDRNQVRALEAERTKATATAEARVQERLRIARDMHDVVAHTLSIVSVQAGLARRLVPTRPDDAVEAIERVEQSAREATNDLRRLLGVLREDQADELSPAPGIRELESLAEDHGAHVTLSVSGDPDSLADSLKLTIFRIVQESLTNARKHAPGAPVRVSVSEEDGGATIAVANAASTVAERGAGTSWGLTGLRERVELYGGELHAARTDSGGLEVRLRL